MSESSVGSNPTLSARIRIDRNEFKSAMTPERRDALFRDLTRQLTAMAASTGWGPDIDWIASDRDGHLAVFATAVRSFLFRLRPLAPRPIRSGPPVPGHPYRRVGVTPPEPISIKSFGPNAADYLRDVRFWELCFSQSSAIVIVDAFEEIYRPTDWDRWSRPELLRPVAPRPRPPTDKTDKPDAGHV